MDEGSPFLRSARNRDAGGQRLDERPVVRGRSKGGNLHSRLDSEFLGKGLAGVARGHDGVGEVYFLEGIPGRRQAAGMANKAKRSKARPKKPARKLAKKKSEGGGAFEFDHM